MHSEALTSSEISRTHKHKYHMVSLKPKIYEIPILEFTEVLLEHDDHTYPFVSWVRLCLHYGDSSVAVACEASHTSYPSFPEKAMCPMEGKDTHFLHNSRKHHRACHPGARATSTLTVSIASFPERRLTVLQLMSGTGPSLVGPALRSVIIATRLSGVPSAQIYQANLIDLQL